MRAKIVMAFAALGFIALNLGGQGCNGIMGYSAGVLSDGGLGQPCYRGGCMNMNACPPLAPCSAMLVCVDNSCRDPCPDGGTCPSGEVCIVDMKGPGPVYGCVPDSDAGATSGPSSRSWFTVAQTSGTAQGITEVSGLAFANSTTLYWAQPAGQIEECTLTTGATKGAPVNCSNAPTTFATSSGPTHVIAVDDFVYWADAPGVQGGDGNLYACPTNGLSPCHEDGGLLSVVRQGLTETTTDLLGHDTTNLYWAEDQATGGAIFQCPLPCSTAPSSPMVSSPDPVTTFTVLRASLGSLPAGALLWGTASEQLWSCTPSATGCPASMLATLNFAPLGILSDGQGPPLVTGNASVSQLSCSAATGCNLSAIFQVPNDTTMRLNSDSSNIYVATAGGALYAGPRIGGGSLTMLASGQGQINGLVSDGTYLYWTSSNGIIGGVAK